MYPYLVPGPPEADEGRPLRGFRRVFAREAGNRWGVAKAPVVSRATRARLGARDRLPGLGGSSKVLLGLGHGMTRRHMREHKSHLDISSLHVKREGAGFVSPATTHLIACGRLGSVRRSPGAGHAVFDLETLSSSGIFGE